MEAQTSRRDRSAMRFASCFRRQSRSCARPAKASLSASLCLLLLALTLPAEPAGAADPGRWFMTGFSTTKIEYYQGVSSDPQRMLYFDGRFVGLYRTTP